ncbi:MAG: hypothetical protein WCO77_06420 [bacterium]
MKGRRVSILLLCLGVMACGTSASPVVTIGDTYQQMVDKLGKPQGVISGGRRMTCSYERGTVDLVTGRVEKVFFVTTQEAKDRTRAREKAEADQRQRAETDRARLTGAGTVERDRKAADKDFARHPPGERLDYWKNFTAKYPYTDVSALVSEAEKAVQAGQSDRDKESTLAEMTKRVEEIQVRFVQLDDDYAASLANWKRNEIDAERARLKDELATIATRVKELAP